MEIFWKWQWINKRRQDQHWVNLGVSPRNATIENKNRKGVKFVCLSFVCFSIFCPFLCRLSVSVSFVCPSGVCQFVFCLLIVCLSVVCQSVVCLFVVCLFICRLCVCVYAPCARPSGIVIANQALTLSLAKEFVPQFLIPSTGLGTLRCTRC